MFLELDVNIHPQLHGMHLVIGHARSAACIDDIASSLQVLKIIHMLKTEHSHLDHNCQSAQEPVDADAVSKPSRRREWGSRTSGRMGKNGETLKLRACSSITHTHLRIGLEKAKTGHSHS